MIRSSRGGDQPLLLLGRGQAAVVDDEPVERAQPLLVERKLDERACRDILAEIGLGCFFLLEAGDVPVRGAYAFWRSRAALPAPICRRLTSA